MDKIRQIIREEVYRVMNEIGEDPVKIAQNIVRSNEEQVKSLEAEVKFRDNDARVSGLPPEEKKARIEAAKNAKERLDMAKTELELSKQAEINAVQSQQQLQTQDSEMQTTSQTQTITQSQI